MILYHFSTSPFARRVRLVMAMKDLSAELCDPRVDERHWPELHRLNPLQTVPTLVDGALVLTDSLSIVAHLEAKVPAPSIWPAKPADVAEALELLRLADRAIDTILDLGLRYHPLRDHAAWADVKANMLGRAQGALDRIGDRVARSLDAPGAEPHLVGGAWTIDDIAIVTLALRVEGLPARARTAALARQFVDLGWKAPAALTAYLDRHRARADVSALG